jgi:hypothetical protein
MGGLLMRIGRFSGAKFGAGRARSWALAIAYRLSMKVFAEVAVYLRGRPLG